MTRTFQEHGLRIIIDTNLKVANFLDVTFELTTGKYHPYRKPNDHPKVSSKLGLMFRLRKQLTSTVIRDVYQTCVLPVVEYGSLAWRSMDKTNSQLLDRVNPRATRLVSGVKLVDNISHDLLLSRAGLTPLVAHRHFRLAKFASRFLSNSVPAHLSEALEHWRQSVPFRSMLLRRPPAVRHPRARKKILSLSPLCLALSLLKSLPPELRSSPFSVLKSHFMDLS